jgi:5-methylcytosine-specific restriction endonuclease McrA
VKTCEQCGLEFKPWHKHNRFCSQACWNQARCVRSADDTRVRRRQREGLAPGLTTHARTQLLSQWVLQGRTCAYCPRPATTVDHLIPLVRGGTNHEGNLTPACRSCNASKGAKTVAEWRHGKPAQRMTGALPWLGKPKREAKPYRSRLLPLLYSCIMCGTPTPTLCCSPSCAEERNRRVARDFYRKRNGLPWSHHEPTKTMTKRAA